MRRIRLSLAAVAALLVATTMGSSVLAQEQATDEHPIIGAWITDATPDDAIEPDELVVFLPGGVVINTAQGGTGAGTWSPTGERTADLTFAAAVHNPEAGFLGLITIRSSVEVSEDGQTFTGTYTFEAPTAVSEAFGLPPGELGPGDVTGQRVALEPMGEPAGPLPDFSQQGGPGASPAAPGTSPMAPGASPAADASPAVEASPMVEGSPAAG